MALVKPVEDVRDISAITYGFMASKALFAALDFDLFTQIERGADTLAGLAKATGVPENRLLGLIAALKSVGLIVEREDRFANAPATAKFLVAGAPGDFRDYVRLVNGAFGYEAFRHLTPALRGERIFPDKGFYEGMIYSAGIGGEAFSSAQHAGSLGPARMMAKRVELGGRKRLLDIGGGSGAYTLAFCAANPELNATILDFPQTVETARRYAREAGVADRVAHLAGDAAKTEWPGGHDVSAHVLCLERRRRRGHRRPRQASLRRAPSRRARPRPRLHGGQCPWRAAIRGLVSAAGASSTIRTRSASRRPLSRPLFARRASRSTQPRSCCRESPC